MSNKQFLALPYGKDDFTKLRAQDCYFVDKTPYIKQVFGVDSSDVLLARQLFKEKIFVVIVCAYFCAYIRF